MKACTTMLISFVKVKRLGGYIDVADTATCIIHDVDYQHDYMIQVLQVHMMLMHVSFLSTQVVNISSIHTTIVTSGFFIDCRAI